MTNSISSVSNFPRIKNGSHVINPDDKNIKGAHWVSLFLDANTVAYIDSFGNCIHSSRSIKQNQRQINYSQYIYNTR